MSGSQSNLIEILQERVHSFFAEGKVEEAQRVAQTALDAARRAVDSDPSKRGQLIATLETLGDISLHFGDSEAAEALYCEAIEYLHMDGGEDVQVARIESSLAGLYDFGQREGEAIPLYEDAIELFESADPPMPLEAANLRNNLAMIYKGAGEDEKAEKHYLASINSFEEVHGHESEEVASVYNNLGALYYQSGHQEQAREIHLSALEIRRSLFGDNHPEVGQSHSNVALVYHALGDAESCQHNFEKSIKILEGHAAEEPENYSVIVENYVELLRVSGEEKKADSVEKRMRKVLKKNSGKKGFFSRRKP